MAFMLKHGPGNPRNSEGSFVRLADGRLLLIYTRYRGESHHDHAVADLVRRISADGGETWSEPEIVVANPAMNVMSVSLLRLADGRIALLCLVKSEIRGFPGFVDCRPWIRFSADEAASWSDPVEIAGIPPVYLVVANDRLVQLASGRLIVPISHEPYLKNGAFDANSVFFCLSDDGGSSWRRSATVLHPPAWLKRGFQEPGVIELADGRLMAWCRSTAGWQWKCFSADGGETWSEMIPAPEFKSPNSPLSMKRHPETGELWAVWNDYAPQRAVHFEPWRNGLGRTPLVLARSRDEGATWSDHMLLESAPDHGYAYIAMLFLENNRLLLEYCCGNRVDCDNMLQDSCVRIVDLPERSTGC